MPGYGGVSAVSPPLCFFTPFSKIAKAKLNCIIEYVASQKGFTVDFLTKKRKINEGEVPQYYVENSHPAIISAEAFDLVQRELAQRKGHYTTNVSPFSSRIVCGDCGNFYGSKVWHSTDQYRRVIWQCNSKFKNDRKCTTPHFTEEQLKQMFVGAFNEMFAGKAAVLQAYDAVLASFSDNTALDDEAANLEGECNVVLELMRKCVEENASAVLDQMEYTQRYEGLVKRYEAAKKRLAGINARILTRKAKYEQIRGFIKALRKRDAALKEFDETLFGVAVDHIIVRSASEATFIWNNGMETQWKRK